MGTGFAAVTEDDGVVVRSAELNGFTVGELRFPASYVQDPFEPELPYAACVLDGAVEKSFRSRTLQLGRGAAFTIPAGAWHGARFGATGARIVIVKSNSVSSPAAAPLRRLVVLRGRGLSWLAWRLAGELRATDAAAPLAAEGFALELLAATSREAGTERRLGRSPPWLVRAEELLRDHTGDCLRLGELADAAGVHPTHLARAFRARYGISVGEYGRRARVEWAATEVARGGLPIAAIAAEAGFADQSHFTRVFRHYVGTTPARYRRDMRAPAVPN